MSEPSVPKEKLQKHITRNLRKIEDEFFFEDPDDDIVHEACVDTMEPAAEHLTPLHELPVDHEDITERMKRMNQDPDEVWGDACKRIIDRKEGRIP